MDLTENKSSSLVTMFEITHGGKLLHRDGIVISSDFVI